MVNYLAHLKIIFGRLGYSLESQNVKGVHSEISYIILSCRDKNWLIYYPSPLIFQLYFGDFSKTELQNFDTNLHFWFLQSEIVWTWYYKLYYRKYLRRKPKLSHVGVSIQRLRRALNATEGVKWKSKRYHTFHLRDQLPIPNKSLETIPWDHLSNISSFTFVPQTRFKTSSKFSDDITRQTSSSSAIFEITYNAMRTVKFIYRPAVLY